MRYTQTGVTLASYGWQPIPEPPLPKGGGGVAAGGDSAITQPDSNNPLTMVSLGTLSRLRRQLPLKREPWGLRAAPTAPFEEGALVGDGSLV